MTIYKEKFGYAFIALITTIATVVVVAADPISQDLNYHNFADLRTFLSVPNFWNVSSNIPFLFVGVLGLIKVNNLSVLYDMKLAYMMFFIGVSLVAFGSSYYHLAPNNASLVWDRLPMTIAFMTLFAIIIGEFISLRIAKLVLFPFVIIGAFSVFYWNYTQGLGEGDLRLYALVQFLPIILIPMILLLFKSKVPTSGYWWLLFAYILAKVLEHFDAEIFTFLNFISGHSLKHVAAAIGIYLLLYSYKSTQKE